MPMSDKEQIDLVKSWWKEYGYYILFTIALVLLVNFGWRYFHNYRQHNLEYTSASYLKMLEYYDQKKVDEYQAIAKQLINSHKSSVYASLAALLLAKDDISAGNYQEASAQFNFVIKKSPAKNLRQLARLRLARVLIETKKYADALQLLQKVDDKGYKAAIEEARGDALFKLGRLDEARVSYQQAKDLRAGNELQPPLLKAKLQQL